MNVGGIRFTFLPPAFTDLWPLTSDYSPKVTNSVTPTLLGFLGYWSDNLSVLPVELLSLTLFDFSSPLARCFLTKVINGKQKRKKTSCWRRRERRQFEPWLILFGFVARLNALKLWPYLCTVALAEVAVVKSGSHHHITAVRVINHRSLGCSWLYAPAH